LFIKVLAFDQSLSCTGWCVFENSEHMCHGLINLKSIAPNIRPQYMLDAMVSKIKSYEPDVVVLEDVVLQRNVKTLKDLAKLQGAVIGVCDYLKIQYKIIGCSAWRKQLKFKQGSGIKRAELKQQAHDYVVEHFGIETSEDECDAICMGWAYQESVEETSNC